VFELKAIKKGILRQKVLLGKRDLVLPQPYKACAVLIMFHVKHKATGTGKNAAQGRSQPIQEAKTDNANGETGQRKAAGRLLADTEM
jgi:hypothetical protein